MLPLHKDDSSSKGKKFIPGIGVFAHATNWIRSFLSKPASRNLFCFLLLNLTFAFVELVYGAWTNSLGLIADSFHMFFDCTALLAGLVATVITRWSSNERYSYGYVRAEVLAGFVNGLFLLFIAFFILSEAIERAFQPPEVKHDRLMIVSILGFLVNLVGIFAFQHGGAMHGHSHGGDGHGHSHGGHGHSHGDEGGADRQILQGVLLHVMADTLGSVGVIISSFLIQQFGWMMADPICSMCIAVLIGVSVIPLLQSSVGVLMQRAPPSLDRQLDTCYQRVQQIDGVAGIKDPHFWTLCSDVYMGSMRILVIPDTDVFRVSEQARSIFTQVGVRQLTIQVDRQE